MREEFFEEIEVHVSGICIKGDYVLCGKRTASRQLYPNKWECGGGAVKKGESFETACLRQLQEEYGVNVEIIRIVGTYIIKTSDKTIPGLTFLCCITDQNSPNPDCNEFCDVRFIHFSDLSKYDFIPGVLSDINKAFFMLSTE